jgi:hypothetical protein
MKPKLKIIKKEIKTPCYCCNKSLYGKTSCRKNCPACKGTGQYIEYIYHHIYTGKNGKKYCIDGDTLK